MGKPAKTLTQLEEEPQTAFYGATYSELLAVMRRTLLYVLVCAAGLGLLRLHPALAAVIAVISAVPVFIYQIKKISSNRAGKPLYYHLHVRTTKDGWFAKSPFIRPRRHYQRERNDYGKKK